MKLLGELRDTLAKVEDPATLKAAMPALTKISTELDAAQKKLNDQQISTEQQRDLRAKWGTDLKKLQDDLVEQAKRIDALKSIEEKDRDLLVATITPATASITP